METDTGVSGKPFSKVIIVGAGPSGMLLALLLAQHDIPSILLEAYPSLDTRLRASQYGVPATRVFRRAAILDDIRKEALSSFPCITWRRVEDGQKLAAIDMSCVKDHDDRMTILPLGTMIQIMYRHCLERGKGGDLIDVKFGHRVVDVGQDENMAWVQVDVGGGGLRRLEADYVIGCDGSTSQVRKSLFGRHWPGDTFPFRLIVTNVSSSPLVMLQDVLMRKINADIIRWIREAWLARRQLLRRQQVVGLDS
jgi:2-polyprenyl-6-methoxyphenol hydroxylase-like FAD-dependent oxidoreductase